MFVKCHLMTNGTGTYKNDIWCGQNLWKHFTFNIPVSILSTLGHILKLYNCLPQNPVEDEGGDVTTQSRSGGRVSRVAGGVWMDGEQPLHALQDFLAESRVHPCSGPPNKVFIVKWA